MSILELIVRLVAGVVLVLMNGFFVTVEFALTRLRQFPAETFEDAGPGLRRAWEMTDKLEIYLTGCQLGITTSSVLLGVVTEPAVTEAIRPLAELARVPERALPGVSVAVAVVIINLVHKVWGEQAPTYLGVEAPILVARWCALPLFWWTRVMYPAIYFGDGLAKGTLRLFGVTIERSWTEAEEETPDGAEREGAGEDVGPAELRRQMGQVLARGDLPPDRRKEVIRALEIGHTPVSDIMVPREEIVHLSSDRPPEENLEILGQGVSRYPLTGEDLDDLRGVIYLPAVVEHLDALRSGETSLEEIAVEPLTVPPELSVADLIDRFQDERQELALVVDEDGRLVGLVTITETLEAIAGEAEDPYD